jgi:MFS family permease
MVAGGIVSPFVGWLIDRSGPKRLYLSGIAMLAAAYLLYLVAPDWKLTIAAMAAFWLGNSMSTQSCATVCGNCLANRDRATGMMICESVTAGLLGMIGPILAAWIVRNSGGVNPDGIRPVFLVCFAGTIGTFTFVWKTLSNRRWGMGRKAPNIIRDLAQVLKEGRHLKQWLVIASMGQLPMGMIFPFASVFANQYKGADEVVLGAMVTGAAVTSMLLGVPLGRLADKLGRKRALYMAIPLFWTSIVMLVWSPGPLFVVIAGVLQGFYYISSPIAAAMERELVPADQMGRWLGIARFVKMMTLAIFTFAAGLIWDRFGPAYVFFTFIGFDLLVRMPLLIKMPETLGLRLAKSPSSER